jgi:phenylpyruvate tautomerase PptA (4-oxalocrotonate tautomerase family)
MTVSSSLINMSLNNFFTIPATWESNAKEVVFINITFSNWRDMAAKQRLYRRLAELLSANAGLRPEDVQVILSPNTREDWSFGNGLASYVKDVRARSQELESRS